MSEELLEMKLSRLKELVDMDKSKSVIDSVERALNGTGTDLDSPYIYIADQFYKIVL